MFPLTRVNGPQQPPEGVRTRTFYFCNHCAAAPRLLATRRHHLSYGCHSCLAPATQTLDLTVYPDPHEDDLLCVVDPHARAATVTVAGDPKAVRQAIEAHLQAQRPVILDFTDHPTPDDAYLGIMVGPIMARYGKPRVGQMLFTTGDSEALSERLALILRIAQMRVDIHRSRHAGPATFETVAAALAA